VTREISILRQLILTEYFDNINKGFFWQLSEAMPETLFSSLSLLSPRDCNKCNTTAEGCKIKFILTPFGQFLINFSLRIVTLLKKSLLRPKSAQVQEKRKCQQNKVSN
jgi:hypothetical protein